jgi:Polyketide cyclase / dehydrase and lipid transport
MIGLSIPPAVMVTRLLLAAYLLFTALGARAATELPAITVTGEIKPPGDIVSRDRDQRSPEIHWPTALSIKWSEVFAHNGIVINAPCATVWNYLVQAREWPQWCPFSGKVVIQDGSPILQKNTKFTWRGFDLPQDGLAEYQHRSEPLYAKVIECEHERRIGWYSSGIIGVHGPLYLAYHTWLITPTGPKKCYVTFEEVATGSLAGYARGFYPEVVHASHQNWLERLKRVSENHG